MLLAPQTKIPMILWWEWSDIIYDQTGIISRVLKAHGYDDKADMFDHYRGELKNLWLRTRDDPRNQEYRQNYANIYKRILRELPDAAEILQDVLQDDWRGSFMGGFKTQDGEKIFGHPDYDHPYGVADGWPRQGYLTYIMRNMIMDQVGFLYLGALKPRDGLTFGEIPALGYEAAARQEVEHLLMRRSFMPAKPA